MARDQKFLKRQKERARQERKARKAQRRSERKAQRAADPRTDAGEDPDIAGIVPGPQPPLWDQENAESGQPSDSEIDADEGQDDTNEQEPVRS